MQLTVVLIFVVVALAAAVDPSDLTGAEHRNRHYGSNYNSYQQYDSYYPSSHYGSYPSTNHYGSGHYGGHRYGRSVSDVPDLATAERRHNNYYGGHYNSPYSYQNNDYKPTYSSYPSYYPSYPSYSSYDNYPSYGGYNSY